MLEVTEGLVVVSSLAEENTVGMLEVTAFRKIRNLIPFHVFSILLQIVSKYLLQLACLLSLIREESKFM